MSDVKVLINKLMELRVSVAEALKQVKLTPWIRKEKLKLFELDDAVLQEVDQSPFSKNSEIVLLIAQITKDMQEIERWKSMINNGGVKFDWQGEGILTSKVPKNVSIHYFSVLDVLKRWNLELLDGQHEKLKCNEKLLKAILQFDDGLERVANPTFAQEMSYFLSADLSTEQGSPLIIYGKETLQLALKGKEAFKNEYFAVEQKAFSAMEDHPFIELLRGLANLLLVALGIVPLGAGVFALLATSEKRGGFLFFKSPSDDLENASRELFNALELKKVPL